MATELAYSEQFNDVINAERAYELYWAGVINDRRAFACPHDGCPARYTCVNLETDALNLQVQPHYRVRHRGPAHADGCPYAAEREPQQGGTAGEGQTHAVGAPPPDRFLFERPADYFTVRDAAPAAGTGSGGTRGGGGDAAGLRSRRTDFYSVASLVSRWLKARRDGTDDTQTLTAGATSALSYRDMFENFSPRRPRLSGQARVYWGKAKIAQTPDGYRIRFMTRVEALGEETLDPPQAPTAMVWNSALNASKMGALHIKRLQRFAASGEACVVFIFGTPTLETSRKDQRRYLNFKVTRVDHVDVQADDVYERMKRPPG